MIDASQHFVSAAYYPDGNGPLAFSCYARLSLLAHAVVVPKSYLNTKAKVREYANGNVSLYNQIVAYGKACITSGVNNRFQ